MGPTPRPPQRPLASVRVRYVGEPVAVVVAETVQQAKDAAESICLDIDLLPAVITASAAVAPDAPQLHADAPARSARKRPLIPNMSACSTLRARWASR
jgi:aerobic carbon-monoxide dehydrogenase large subunit